MVIKHYSRRRVRRRISKKEQAQDLFETLPDELILKIMEIIQDAKTLVRCLALSKRFASLVSTTRFVSLSIHRPKLGLQCCYLAAQPFEISLNGNFANQDTVYAVGSRSSSLFLPFGMHWHYKSKHRERTGLRYLDCFKEIHHLSIRFSYGDIPYRCNDVVKWRVELSSELPLGFKSCVILERNRLDFPGSGYMTRRLRTGWVKRRIKWIASMMRLVFEMKPVLGCIMRDHTMLKDVAVGDAKGEIHAGEDMRRDAIRGVETMVLAIQSWSVPLVDLSKPVLRAVEGKNCTASSVIVTVVQPAVLSKGDWVGLVRSSLGDAELGSELAEKIKSTPSTVDLATVVKMGH